MKNFRGWKEINLKIPEGDENSHGIPGGKVSENGYPRQGVQTISEKARYMLYIILYRGRRILGHIS